MKIMGRMSSKNENVYRGGKKEGNGIGRKKSSLMKQLMLRKWKLKTKFGSAWQRCHHRMSLKKYSNSRIRDQEPQGKQFGSANCETSWFVSHKRRNAINRQRLPGHFEGEFEGEGFDHFAWHARPELISSFVISYFFHIFPVLMIF